MTNASQATAIALAVMTSVTLSGCRSLPPSTEAGRQMPQQMEKTITKVVKAGYLLYLPKEYGQEPGRKWPVLMFLHGSGESGADLEKVKVHGPPKLIAQGKEFPFIVVSPRRHWFPAADGKWTCSIRSSMKSSPNTPWIRTGFT